MERGLHGKMDIWTQVRLQVDLGANTPFSCRSGISTKAVACSEAKTLSLKDIGVGHILLKISIFSAPRLAVFLLKGS